MFEDHSFWNGTWRAAGLCLIQDAAGLLVLEHPCRFDALGWDLACYECMPGANRQAASLLKVSELRIMLENDAAIPDANSLARFAIRGR